MAAELRLTDDCPACGQLVMFALPATIGPRGRLEMTLTVDPGDHPCPGAGAGSSPEKTEPALPTDAVPEDHAS